MKKISKSLPIVFSALVLLFVVSISTPALVKAEGGVSGSGSSSGETETSQNSSDSTSTGDNKRSSSGSGESLSKLAGTGICVNADNIGNRLNGLIESKSSKVNQKHHEAATDLSTKRESWDKQITEDRTKWDAKWSENFTKLESKATTDNQKVAVTQYEVAIKDAVATRRAAFDANRVTFRSSVDSTITSRQATTSTQLAVFKTAVDSAVTKAKSSCAAGTKSPDVQKNLKADIAAARNTFKANRKGDGTGTDSVKTAAATRSSSDAAATKAFKEAVKKARTDLLLAFKGTSAEL